ncbi:hypothetical protein [Maricaulis sp.]|uniref:hypothetical protein n=1 Tax=Maricaulis sp. TaxID=1486257 RepID=UPI0025C04053|nr:hypothetical protein [Maricaulis sp.]
MKSIIIAGLAAGATGLALSDSAMAQDGWTVLDCTMETTAYVLRDETREVAQPGTQQIRFRVSASGFERYSPENARWESLCAALFDSISPRCDFEPGRVSSDFELPLGGAEVSMGLPQMRYPPPAWTERTSIDLRSGALAYFRRNVETIEWVDVRHVVTQTEIRGGGACTVQAGP